jgi:hypothetical protein
MKAMLLQNLAPHAALANGSRGIITDIILDPREQIEHAGSCSVELQFPPAVILFKPVNAQNICLRGLPDGILPIFPSSVTFKLGGKSGIPVDRQHIAITPAYAFTDFKSQGQTIESIIIDLGKPPMGSLTPFNAYVALSRSRGRKTIRLLRDFSEKLFTVHPNDELRKEDERLAALAETTRERYRRGEFGRF